MFKKRHPAAGSRPGTLVIPQDSPRPRIRLTQITPDGIRDQPVTDLECLRSCRSPEVRTWIDVQGLGDEATLLKLAEIFEIHPLALEDIVNVPQRAKCEVYDTQELIICRSAELGADGRVAVAQISMILGQDFVITFQQNYHDAFAAIRHRMEQPDARLRRLGHDYLAYAIVDSVIDGYFPILELLGERIELLEDLAFTHPTPQLLRVLASLKNQVAGLQRTIRPQATAVHTMLREEGTLISQPVRVYLRDTHDHCLQVAEVIDMYREMLTGLLNTYLSSLGQRTNEVMKVLTIMASIFIPLTFIAGIYGMNFEHMPELQLQWAYPMVWTTMLLTAGGMLTYFWRKGWISPSSIGGDPLDSFGMQPVSPPPAIVTREPQIPQSPGAMIDQPELPHRNGEPVSEEFRLGVPETNAQLEHAA